MIEQQIFQHGMDLAEIYFVGGGSLIAGKSCDRITVSMENGQMAGVAWVLVERGNEKTLWNAAQLEGVKL